MAWCTVTFLYNAFVGFPLFIPQTETTGESLSSYKYNRSKIMEFFLILAALSGAAYGAYRMTPKN